MRVLITGAAGNLGSMLARRLLTTSHQLRLLVHRKEPPADITSSGKVEVFQADLGNPSAIMPVCENVACIVHLAGVLFAPRPSKFLPRTNLGFVQNLLSAAQLAGVKKFILVSFPHVEGETTPEHPATDRVDRTPDVIHFSTRLAAERAVLDGCSRSSMTPIILRAGVVYGRGVKLTEAARRLLRCRILSVWRKPTWIHLISLPDFLSAVVAAIDHQNVRGIYNVCDDEPLTVQDFLDRLAAHYGYKKPWRLPKWTFHFAAIACETGALVLGTAAPLTRDIVKAGMTSSVADNSRMKRELISRLAYPTLKDGFTLL